MISLEAQLEQKSAQLAAVREISQAIAEAQDQNEITRRTTEVMHVDSCSIYLYDQPGDNLVLAASTGLNQAGIGHYSLSHGAGLTGWAAEFCEPIAITDAFSDPRFYRILGSGESKFPSLMAMPLVSRDRVIGAANVQTVERHEFTVDEIELFSFITELAATALEKAQLVHTALVKEMHHRVKNNLQTIAMLLRLQMGQEKALSPQDVLNESINRVLSIASVHEILSEAVADQVDVLDLIRRVSTTISGNMIMPTANISISVSGDSIHLRSQRATGLALVANELLQNAVEHGLAGGADGNITANLTRAHNYLKLKVTDNGRGLPPGFEMETDIGLGLNIVRTSVLEDMQGTFSIGNNPNGNGVEVQITVPIQ
jgi:two-component sensor histidine kinase